MPFALLASLRAVRRNRPDVLFSTSSPYGSHLVALVVARLTGMPWVADFRDEWAANPYLAGQPRLLAWLSRRAEQAITARATQVVVAADYFRLAGLDSEDSRRTVIVNGVDEDDLITRDAPRSRDRFVLAHVGSIYEIRDPAVVLHALQSLIVRGEIPRERLEVRLVGNLWIPGFAFPSGVDVTATGYVEHAQAVAEMAAATALLLYIAPGDLAPSGKLFEYLASGRPLLCLAPEENLASRLVREWDAGVAVDPRDKDQIERAILTLWRRWHERGLPDLTDVRKRAVERYSRRATAEQLKRVLERAAGSA
jgi:glycosyltransferase involved in cell wall biosynthesis